jgi:hypothetical protein
MGAIVAMGGDRASKAELESRWRAEHAGAVRAETTPLKDTGCRLHNSVSFRQYAPNSTERQ